MQNSQENYHDDEKPLPPGTPSSEPVKEPYEEEDRPVKDPFVPGKKEPRL